ncbi:Telomerase reverse transcriptase [Gracilaria domingensis]|nr:Telomerase reverse transcriptase [Gracilaria domingensis]
MAVPARTDVEYKNRLQRIALRFYPHVVSLDEYIHMINEHLPSKLVVHHGSDSASYKRLLSSLLIAFPSQPSIPKNALEGLPLKSVSMDDVLTQVISSTLRRYQNTSEKPDQVNVLCNGFFISKQDGSGSMFRDLDVRGPSTSIQQLRGPNFGILLSRVGYVVFRHFLMETTLLLGIEERELNSTPKTQVMLAKLPSCALLQICGPASVPKQAMNCKISSNKEQKKCLTIDTNVVIKRDVMYRTPPSHPRFKKLCTAEHVKNGGLPVGHHLHRFSPSLKSAEHLVRIIFPICDGKMEDKKANKSASFWAAEVSDNIRRYDIIATSLLKSKRKDRVSSAPIPSRLRPLVPILRDLLSRVQRHCFRKLLGMRCPLPMGFNGSETSDTRLLSMYTNQKHVAKYLSACLQRAFPGKVFGSSKNRGVIYKAVNHFVCKRNEMESFDLGAFIFQEGFKLCDVPWLHRKGPGGHRTRNPNDLRYRTARIIEFATWVLRGFLIPLINQSFYVTEADRHRYRIFFYRREVWTILYDRAEKQHYEDTQRFEVMSKDDFHVCSRQQMKVHSTINSSKLGTLMYHDLRFVPKKSSLRGIQRPRAKLLCSDFQRLNTISIKRLCKRNKTAINAVMKDFVRILSREARGRDSSTGAAVFGLDDIYRKFIRTKDQWRRKGCPTLYACALDIKTSFDTIPLKKLFEDVVPQLFLKDRYVLLRYKLSKPQIGTGRILNRFLTYVCTKPGEETSFQSVVRTDLARAHTGGLFSDLVRMRTWSKGVICSLLSEALSNNIVSMSRRQHRKPHSSGFAIQRHGLPQGHPVSQLLTSLFYGFIEQHDLGEYLEVPEKVTKQEAMHNDNNAKPLCPPKETVVLLMRLVDDTLFFSSSRTQAKQFLSQMIEESRSTSYGFSINKDKAKTNFVSPLVPHEPRRFIPWCGILVDTRDFEIRGDFARYKTQFDDRLRNAMKIEYDGGPCRRMAEKAFSCFKPKLHPLMFDGQINSRNTVVLNIYQSALLSCMKLCSYANEIKPRNVQFFVSMVDTSVSNFAELVHRCTTSYKARAHNCRLPCSMLEVRYVCRHSYSEGFRRKLRNRRGMSDLAEATIQSLQSNLSSITRVLDSRNGSNAIPQLCKKIAATQCKCIWDLRL